MGQEMGVSPESALDQPGSANVATFRRSVGFAALVLVLALGIVAFGHLQLAALPQFATFQATFVFLADAITGFLLLGQFHYRRKASYAVLGCAYLLNALLMIPFLLSFPEGLRAQGVVIGGAQSAIWIWHIAHIVFPLLLAGALAVEARVPGQHVPPRHVTPVVAGAVGLALGLTLAATLVVTQFHDRLPVLIGNTRPPLTPAFYTVGWLTAAVTALALLLVGQHAWRQRTVLHLWLAVALVACLADVAGSLASSGRYTVGWYFGRVESMIAGSVLLLVFIGEINGLYRRLGSAVRDLSAANDQLVRAVQEKESLLVELRRSEAGVRQLAYYDPLTELPNRRLLIDRMKTAISQATRHQQAMAVMFLDLDHFKEINDTLGHEAGDALLKEVASRLQGCVRSGDTVSRLGGDEFVIVLAELARPGDANRVAEKIIQALKEPILIGGRPLQVSTSIGIAELPADGDESMEKLMQRADAALYAAKDAGRNTYRHSQW